MKNYQKNSSGLKMQNVKCKARSHCSFSILILGSAVILLLGKPEFLFSQEPSSDKFEPVYATVLGNNVNIRAGAGLNFEALGQLNKAAQVIVIDQKYDWYKIKLPREVRSFVHKDHINERVVIANKLRVRAGPGCNFNVLGMLEKGQLVNVLEEDGNWLKITPPENCTGWINKDYLELSKRKAIVRIPRLSPLVQKEIIEEEKVKTAIVKKEKKIKREHTQKKEQEKERRDFIARHLAEGKTYFNQQQYQKAIKEFEKTLFIDPKNSLAEKYILRCKKNFTKAKRHEGARLKKEQERQAREEKLTRLKEEKGEKLRLRREAEEKRQEEARLKKEQKRQAREEKLAKLQAEKGEKLRLRREAEEKRQEEARLKKEQEHLAEEQACLKKKQELQHQVESEQKVHKEPKTIEAWGMIQDLGKIFNRPGTHKLVVSEKFLYYLKSETIDLKPYVYDNVNVIGELIEVENFPYPVINVEQIKSQR